MLVNVFFGITTGCPDFSDTIEGKSLEYSFNDLADDVNSILAEIMGKTTLSGFLLIKLFIYGVGHCQWQLLVVVVSCPAFLGSAGILVPPIKTTRYKSAR
jgi:hypothetical protein